MSSMGASRSFPIGNISLVQMGIELSSSQTRNRTYIRPFFSRLIMLVVGLGCGIRWNNVGRPRAEIRRQIVPVAVNNIGGALKDGWNAAEMIRLTHYEAGAISTSSGCTLGVTAPDPGSSTPNAIFPTFSFFGFFGALGFFPPGVSVPSAVAAASTASSALLFLPLFVGPPVGVPVPVPPLPAALSAPVPAWAVAEDVAG